MAYSVWQRYITNGETVVTDATVTVRLESDGSLATIYSDSTGTAKANPFTVTGAGLAKFYAAAGLYKITATSGSFTSEFRDVAIGEAAAYDVGADGASKLLTRDQLDARYGVGSQVEAWRLRGSSLGPAISKGSAMGNGTCLNVGETRLYELTPTQVHVYALSTAGDLATLNTTPTSSFTYNGTHASGNSIRVSTDEDKIFILETTNDYIHEWDVGTPGAVSTMSYVDFLDISGVTTTPVGFDFNDDGDFMLVMSAAGQVFDFTLTAWDISTGLNNTSRNASQLGISGASNPVDISLANGGTMLFVIDDLDDGIYAAKFGTAEDITDNVAWADFVKLGGELGGNYSGLHINSAGTRIFFGDTQFDAWRSINTIAVVPS